MINEFSINNASTININKNGSEYEISIYGKLPQRIKYSDLNIPKEVADKTPDYYKSGEFYEFHYTIKIKRWYGSYAGEDYVEFLKVEIEREYYNGNWTKCPTITIASHNNTWNEEKVQEHYRLCDDCTKFVREACKWCAEHWTI